MKKVYYFIVLFIVFFMFPFHESLALSQKTKTLSRDIKSKCEKLISADAKLLMSFLNSLTKEDVEHINANPAGSFSDFIDESENTKAISISKKIRKTVKSGKIRISGSKVLYYDKCKKYGGTLFHEANTFRLFDCWEWGLHRTKIPTKDIDNAINILADYLLFYLDTVITLRGKAESIGLKYLPNRQYWHTGVILPCVTGYKWCASKYVCSLFWFGLVDHLKNASSDSRKKGVIYKAILSNKKALTALKLWSQYLIGNGFCSNDRNEDKFHELADKIDKHYSKLEGKKEEKKKPVIATSFGKCVSGDCQHGEGTLTYPGHKTFLKYVGQFKDGKPNGQGTLFFKKLRACKRKYVGQFKDGKPNGQGTFTWNEYCGGGYPRKYEGKFKNGLPNGQGTMTRRLSENRLFT